MKNKNHGCTPACRNEKNRCGKKLFDVIKKHLDAANISENVCCGRIDIWGHTLTVNISEYIKLPNGKKSPSWAGNLDIEYFSNDTFRIKNLRVGEEIVEKIHRCINRHKKEILAELGPKFIMKSVMTHKKCFS